MATTRYDTVKMVKSLENAGVPVNQAQAHAALLADAIDELDASMVQRFAGKLELAHERAATRTVLEGLDAKLDVTMEKMDARLERFDAKLEGFDVKLEGLDAKLDAGAAKHEAKLDLHAVKLDTKLDLGLEKLKDQMAMLDLKIDKSASEVKSDMMRWVVSVGILQIAVISGLILKFVR